MAELRNCAQCGTVFEPRREHSRFCSSGCRVIWNRSNTRGQPTGDTALNWSAGAMNDTVQRLCKAESIGLPEALALVSEAVWWITIVDATVVRYHRAVYDRSLTRLVPAERRATEGIFTGLRFVRNWMGYHADPADFILPTRDAGGREAPVAAWTWNPLPTPELGDVSPRGRAWETARYRHYCAHLAGKPVGETVNRAVTFLNDVNPAL